MFSASITLDRACENARDTAVSVVARGLGKKMSSKDDHAQYEVMVGVLPTLINSWIMFIILYYKYMLPLIIMTLIKDC